MSERYPLYYDETQPELVLPDITVRPKFLYWSDITTTMGDWKNVAVCNYYNKTSVVLAETE